MKSCKVCRTKFDPRTPMQRVCSPDCALSLAVSNRAKAEKKAQVKERKADKIKRDNQRALPQLKALAQTAFNKFVRTRDAGKPCISCGKPLESGGIGGASDCGHFRSVGSAPHMRYVEDNAHGQCKHCNRHLAGNHVAYRSGLIERIGLRQVELIESDQCVRKYTREALLEIARHYRQKTKELKA